MIATLLRKRTLLFLALVTLIGFFLHFYNLNWGAPYYFHPDERNIASSVSQLNFPSQMNPNFFAYGSLPLYTIYFTGLITNVLATYLTNIFHISPLTSHPLPPAVSFEQAIIISRFYSALFATLLIPILFFLAKNLQRNIRTDTHKDFSAWIVAILATFSVGFIQFAHFGTFEMWLTFFTVILFWLCLKTLHHHKLTTAVSLGLVFGILISTKVSHLALLPVPIAVILLRSPEKNHWLGLFHQLFKNIRNFILFCFTAVIVYIITNPFVFLDTPQFLSSMKYESGVALGTLPVFYTGEFFGKNTAIFQFLHIYPFLINPLLTVIFIPAFLYLIYLTIRTRNMKYVILHTFFLLLFFSQATLFAKWTRYMMPTLPFIYLTISIAIAQIYKIPTLKKELDNKANRIILATLCVFFMASFSLSYFITAFLEPDTRIAAKQFAVRNVPSDAQILSEVYDLGITPFNDTFHNITLFNFYDLDNGSPDWTNQTLRTKIDQSTYIILPSQRLLKTRLLNKQKFPNAYQFYTQLLNGSLGFKKVYESPCDIFCQIAYVGDPIYSFEETANVFDRPEVALFKKL